MTMTLNLPREIQEALTQEARRLGTTPEAVALNELRRFSTETPATEFLARPDAPESPDAPDGRPARVSQFLEWARQQPQDTPLLSAEEISRAAIYRRAEEG